MAAVPKTNPLAEVAARYAVAITPAMDALIDPTDPSDPIAAQFLPDARELIETPEERVDPIGDHAHSPVKGVVHRYKDRCLLKIVHVCPVYCRFCFRREMVGPDGDGALTGQDLENALAYIRATPAIWEVILTGGDPFVLSARRAAEVTQALAAIPHVKIIRWHTRVPLVDPARVTPDFVAALKAQGATAWVALHANHPKEFTPDGQAAVARLVDAGIPLVSQTVLLQGVNDDPVTLDALMRAFVENRIKPYYLHQPDLAPGTSHWRGPIERGEALVEGLRRGASGLCQPAYVLDQPGGHGKARLTQPSARKTPSGLDLCGQDGVWRAFPSQG
jgi:lysine 2,3-aminomutase